MTAQHGHHYPRILSNILFFFITLQEITSLPLSDDWYQDDTPSSMEQIPSFAPSSLQSFSFTNDDDTNNSRCQLKSQEENNNNNNNNNNKDALLLLYGSESIYYVHNFQYSYKLYFENDDTTAVNRNDSDENSGVNELIHSIETQIGNTVLMETFHECAPASTSLSTTSITTTSTSLNSGILQNMMESNNSIRGLVDTKKQQEQRQTRRNLSSNEQQQQQQQDEGIIGLSSNPNGVKTTVLNDCGRDGDGDDNSSTSTSSSSCVMVDGEVAMYFKDRASYTSYQSSDNQVLNIIQNFISENGANLGIVFNGSSSSLSLTGALSAVQKGLISLGSIAVFSLLGYVGYLAFRKRKQGAAANDSDDGSNDDTYGNSDDGSALVHVGYLAFPKRKQGAEANNSDDSTLSGFSSELELGSADGSLLGSDDGSNDSTNDSSYDSADDGSDDSSNDSSDGGSNDSADDSSNSDDGFDDGSVLDSVLGFVFGSDDCDKYDDNEEDKEKQDAKVAANNEDSKNDTKGWRSFLRRKKVVSNDEDSNSEV